MQGKGIGNNKHIRFVPAVTFKNPDSLYTVSFEKGLLSSLDNRWLVTETSLTDLSLQRMVNSKKCSVTEIRFLRGGQAVLFDGKGGELTISGIVAISSFKIKCKTKNEEEKLLFTLPEVPLLTSDWIVCRTSGEDTMGKGVVMAPDLYLTQNQVSLFKDGKPLCPSGEIIELI